ncbi:unnamed protein product [Owenia fusiformis]|uniref:Uncharacterized protein n=1 Tax=Owenia fusiformis TaxID=6347 RepID=A0A8S4P943_OWEFU|nr:unnamed protein product [Owenia fusiformis]
MEEGLMNGINFSPNYTTLKYWYFLPNIQELKYRLFIIKTKANTVFVIFSFRIVIFQEIIMKCNNGTTLAQGMKYAFSKDITLKYQNTEGLLFQTFELHVAKSTHYKCTNSHIRAFSIPEEVTLRMGKGVRMWSKTCISGSAWYLEKGSNWEVFNLQKFNFT